MDGFLDRKTHMNRNADTAARSIGLSKHNFLKLVGYLRLVPVWYKAKKGKCKVVREAFYSPSQVIAIAAAHERVYKNIMQQKDQRAEREL